MSFEIKRCCHSLLYRQTCVAIVVCIVSAFPSTGIRRRKNTPSGSGSAVAAAALISNRSSMEGEKRIAVALFQNKILNFKKFGNACLMPLILSDDTNATVPSYDNRRYSHK